jgi:hypothetical protein
VSYLILLYSFESYTLRRWRNVSTPNPVYSIQSNSI